MRVSFVAVFAAPPCRFLHDLFLTLFGGTRQIERLIIVAQVVDIAGNVDKLGLNIVMVLIIVDLALKLSNQKLFLDILSRHILPLILLSLESDGLDRGRVYSLIPFFELQCLCYLWIQLDVRVFIRV